MKKSFINKSVHAPLSVLETFWKSLEETKLSFLSGYTNAVPIALQIRRELLQRDK
jgi:hypothetical protein